MNLRKSDLAAARQPQEASRTAPARPVEPPKPKLRVVANVRTRRRRASALGFLACAVAFGFMVGITAFQAQLAQNQIEVDQVARDLRAEKLKFDKGRLEIARLQAPEVILARAKKLGMHEPANDPLYIPPSKDSVTEVVIALAGGPDAQASSASSTRPDWAAYKKITGEK